MGEGWLVLIILVTLVALFSGIFFWIDRSLPLNDDDDDL